MAVEQRGDIVFTGGRIWTGIERRRPEDTLVVRDGRVVAIGPIDELSWAIGPRTRVVRLAGRLLLPAFHDSHVHPIGAGLAMGRCQLAGLPDLSACLDAVGAWAAANPEAPWILGEGWSTAVMPDSIAYASDLDTVVADRPAYLETNDGHSAWVNSAAMELAGIRADTLDPRGGHLARDAAGRPVGMLMEDARALVRDLAPRPTADQLEEALLRGQRHLHGLGVAGWLDANVTPPDEAAYRSLSGKGTLVGRVSLALRWETGRWLEQLPELVARREAIEDATEGRIRAPAVKLFQDGIVEIGTAALLQPYLDGRGQPTSHRGESGHPPEALREIVLALDRERFSAHVHAIGDRAVRETLDALAMARKVHGPRDGRHALAHVQLVHRSDLARFAALGAVVSCQPAWACDDPDLELTTRPALGPERTAAMYPFGSLARAGAILAQGSDWNVTTADPLRILETAITRRDPDVRDGRPLGPAAERLAPEVALRAATRGSAYANWSDDTSGTIEIGKRADLVLLDRDPLSPGGGPWGDAQVLLTLVDGQAVWEDPAARA